MELKKMQGLKATMMMIVAELIMAGTNIFFKLAANDGMHLSILIAYRYLFASLIILPLAFFLERGPLAQNLFAKSLVLTSTTFATAFINLVPPFTFILSVLFGLERIEIGKMEGKAKVIGTLVGVAGAMVLTFYKGHQLNIWSTHLNILHGGKHMIGHVAATHNTSIHHSIGSLLAVASSLSIALSLTIQGRISAGYPCHYSSTFLITAMGFVQSLVLDLCTERDWSEWMIGFDIRLLAVLFTGIGLALTITLTTTSIHLRGPLFVANFNPLLLVFTAIGGSLLLDEKLHVGSVLGAVIIIIGLYLMLWGKSNMTRFSKIIPTTTSRCEKDVSTNITNTTTLSTIHVARTSFSTTNGDDRGIGNAL
ncbi:hypothetical protein OSB04_016354 [Centaurea solstitialis]|uniref:WAT1-related protein n=1 Tax=Centaurea solstitialis TaxID=347529 RepID=A0AA38T2E7_9ASTR|nr:hypothetical protein OSB04_016354 [Centaurea solstitialis]